jgi:YD repeat-containing protein
VTTDALGDTSQLAYDANGNIVTERDRAGEMTTHAYYLARRLIRTIYADGTSTSQTYDRHWPRASARSDGSCSVRES